MPTLEQWGPATWTLFHCFAAKIRDESFPIVGKQLLFFIVQISSCLPCPECTGHAKQFFADKVRASAICSKLHLVNMLYAFHNIVNRRKLKKIFDYSLLTSYQSMHLISVYNNFVRYFHTKGNMLALSESFHRSQLLSKFRGWLRANLQHFHILPFSLNPKQINTTELNSDTTELNSDTTELNSDTESIKAPDTAADPLVEPEEEEGLHQVT